MKELGKNLRNAFATGGVSMDILSAIIAAYLWLIRRTGRWQTVNGDTPASFNDAHKPAVFATWHSRIAMGVHCYPDIKSGHALISENKDGEVIARTIKRFGYDSIRGSTRAKHKTKSKGGSRALRQMLRVLRAGDVILVTPDGPRGPRHEASPGIATLARLSGAPIVPFSYSASRAIEFNSWDRFLLPLPFAKGVFVWGEPLSLAPDATEEQQAEFIKRLETSLCQLTDQANAIVGHKSKPGRNADKLQPAPPRAHENHNGDTMLEPVDLKRPQ